MGTLTDSGQPDGIAARMRKIPYRYNVILRPEPEGGFTAMAPALPGCVTYGRSLAEARQMAKDAITGYIESLKKHNEHKEPIPDFLGREIPPPR